MGTHRRLGIIVIAMLSMVASLQACAEGVPANTATKMRSAPLKSNGSGITVRYVVDGEPQSGRAVNLVLTFDGITDPAGASVRLVPDSGLALTVPDAIQGLVAGEPATLTVPVVAGDGIGYLHVFTTQNGVTSVTSIAVQTGKAASSLPSNGQLKQTPGGDKILAMPVK